MSTGYDIRYNILRDAREHLMEEWRAKMELAREEAEGDPPRHVKIIPVPTAEDIKKLAEELYEFVQCKD